MSRHGEHAWHGLAGCNCMLGMDWMAARCLLGMHAKHAIGLDGCKCLQLRCVCAGQARHVIPLPPRPLPCREMLPDGTFSLKAKEVCPAAVMQHGGTTFLRTDITSPVCDHLLPYCLLPHCSSAGGVPGQRAAEAAGRSGAPKSGAVSGGRGAGRVAKRLLVADCNGAASVAFICHCHLSPYCLLAFSPLHGIPPLPWQAAGTSSRPTCCWTARPTAPT